jgi:hypothetical protein
MRLEIRGILVGVSLVSPKIEPFNDDDGGSRPSCRVCELFVPGIPTEGLPAIVGSWLRLRREESDCFCMELTVCAVTRDVFDVNEVRLETEVVGVVCTEDFNFATRCAVAGSSADTCIGGKETGDLGFLGSADDRVWKINYFA